MGTKRFTLYWSSLDMYEKCPQRFLWRKGWGNIDLGNGPGRGKTRPPKKDSKHHAVMGIVIQSVIEKFYNDEIWKSRPPNLTDLLLDMTRKEFALEVQNHYIDWEKAPPREEMLDVCLQGVAGYLKTMKHNKFLGPYSRAEVDLVTWIDQYNPIGGRPDVIIRRDDVGIMILDGKNSKHKGKYTDPDQLRWYALCFYLAYNQMPDKLGFVYYRYPHGSENPETGEMEEGVVWVEFDEGDIRRLAKRAKKARWGMHEEKFDPTPKASNCKFCEWEDECEARKTQRAENSAKRKKDPIDEIEGMQSFGFNDFPTS